MSFLFDDTKDFGANLESFLVHMTDEDPEMGVILRAHISHLRGVTDDAQRRAVRALFNSRVLPDLDALLAETLKRGGA